METKRWSELRPIVVTFGSTLRGSGPAKLPEGLLCPSCGAKDIAVILYGLPGITKELEKAIENKKITLGGCLVYDGAPQWVCNACNRKFGEFRTCEGENILE